jgi:hypothetical protein
MRRGRNFVYRIDSHPRSVRFFAFWLLVTLTRLCAAGSAFNVQCSYSGDNAWLSKTVLSCQLENLEITERGEVIKTSFDSLNQVKGLVIQSQIVNFMPKFSILFAERLKLLQVDYCRLKVILKEDLRQFRHLTHLSLSVNDLEWLDGDLFDFNPELKMVSFWRNDKLMFIGAHLLDSLTKLKQAQFDPAGCISVDANNPEKLSELKEKLITSCKDDVTELKMLEERSETTSKSDSCRLTPVLTQVFLRFMA